MRVFRFIEVEKASYPISMLCRLSSVAEVDVAVVGSDIGFVRRDLVRRFGRAPSEFARERGRGMRPVIDAVWRTSGSRVSPSYDPTGAWKPRN